MQVYRVQCELSPFPLKMAWIVMPCLCDSFLTFCGALTVGVWQKCPRVSKEQYGWDDDHFLICWKIGLHLCLHSSNMVVPGAGVCLCNVVDHGKIEGALKGGRRELAIWAPYCMQWNNMWLAWQCCWQIANVFLLYSRSVAHGVIRQNSSIGMAKLLVRFCHCKVVWSAAHNLVARDYMNGVHEEDMSLYACFLRQTPAGIFVIRWNLLTALQKSILPR